MIEIEKDENIIIYSTISSGSMILNKHILISQSHNQILFHQVTEEIVICEIKPFIVVEDVFEYKIKNTTLKLVQNIDGLYIYFNGKYHGSINEKNIIPQFKKVEAKGEECGILYLDGEFKNIIIFNHKQVLFCGQYMDSEILKDCIQIYTHKSNIFAIGKLIKYQFKTNTLEYIAVKDCGLEYSINNTRFNLIFFMEAIKCGRYKYAYNKLSYQLKSVIDEKTLTNYFQQFDKYVYLHEQRAYVTINNNKIIGVYHIDIKNNLIENIY